MKITADTLTLLTFCNMRHNVAMNERLGRPVTYETSPMDKFVTARLDACGGLIAYEGDLAEQFAIPADNAGAREEFESVIADLLSSAKYADQPDPEREGARIFYEVDGEMGRYERRSRIAKFVTGLLRG